MIQDKRGGGFRVKGLAPKKTVGSKDFERDKKEVPRSRSCAKPLVYAEKGADRGARIPVPLNPEKPG